MRRSLHGVGLNRPEYSIGQGVPHNNNIHSGDPPTSSGIRWFE
eukprot:gene4100-2946_t